MLTPKSLSKGQRTDKKLVDGFPAFSVTVIFSSVTWLVWSISASDFAGFALNLLPGETQFPVLHNVEDPEEKFVRDRGILGFRGRICFPWCWGGDTGKKEKEREWENSRDVIVVDWIIISWIKIIGLEMSKQCDCSLLPVGLQIGPDPHPTLNIGSDSDSISTGNLLSFPWF